MLRGKFIRGRRTPMGRTALKKRGVAKPRSPKLARVNFKSPDIIKRLRGR